MVVIRHPENKEERRKAERVVDEFAKVIKARVLKMFANKEITTIIAPTGEALLDMRRALIQSVKEGMLERKDQEETIGVLTALIWFNRLEQQRQKDILSYWLGG